MSQKFNGIEYVYYDDYQRIEQELELLRTENSILKQKLSESLKESEGITTDHVEDMYWNTHYREV